MDIFPLSAMKASLQIRKPVREPTAEGKVVCRIDTHCINHANTGICMGEREKTLALLVAERPFSGNSLYD